MYIKGILNGGPATLCMVKVGMSFFMKFLARRWVERHYDLQLLLKLTTGSVGDLQAHVQLHTKACMRLTNMKVKT